MYDETLQQGLYIQLVHERGSIGAAIVALSVAMILLSKMLHLLELGAHHARLAS